MIKRLTIIFALLISLYTDVFSQKKEFIFKHLTTNEGLIDNFVTDIVEDKDGFLWVGTLNGLNKYDGINFLLYQNELSDTTSLGNNHVYELFLDRTGDLWVGTLGGGLTYYDKKKNTFINYRNDPSNPSSISNNTVKAIDEDQYGNLWVGTLDGLNYFDKKTKKFKRIRNVPNQSNSISSNNIWDVKVDHKNTLWVATHGGGLNHLTADGSFIHYNNNPANKQTLSSDLTTKLYEDSKNRLWIGTLNGLNLYIPERNGFKTFQHNDKDEASISHNAIRGIYEDARGTLWVGTENGGLSLLPPNQESFITLKSDEKKNYSINSNSIQCIYKDRAGTMWMGTFSGGINYCLKQSDLFTTFKHDKLESNSLSNDYILYMCSTKSEKLVIGTDGGGLNIYDTKSKKFNHYLHSSNSTSIPSNFVTAVLEDRDQDIWTGTYLGGFSKMDKNQETFYTYKADGSNKGTSDPTIWCMAEDKEGYLWLSENEKGLTRFDKKNNLFRHFKPNPRMADSLNDANINALFCDSKGTVWIGTLNHGLIYIDKKNYTFHGFTHEPKNKTSISHDNVLSIFEDSNKNLWVGTFSGLNLFDQKSKTFKVFDEKNGLANNVVLDIIEDKKKNIWIATGKGVSKFNATSQRFKNFVVTDGLQENTFKKNTISIDHNGVIYVGGIHGFNAFHPDSIPDGSLFPHVFITDFKLFNKIVLPGDKNNILKKNLRYTDTITLNYNQTFFSFDFIAPDYANPDGIYYSYKMEGFNKDWVSVDNIKSATYTNLDPGEYVFKVKATNTKGVWGTKETRIQLIIVPPYWKTWWFKTASYIFILTLIIAIYLARTKYIRKVNRSLTDQVRTRTLEINNQKEEILLQNDKLSVAYNDIQDSILYAKTIQDGMAPNPSSAQEYLEEVFVLNMPRDVVSGDFYWYTKKAGKIILAAVDCTGHGVPGAFMSMVGNALLNQIVNIDNVISPELILEELNRGVKSMLKQDNSTSKNGMDLAICVIDPERKIIEYSGAINPIVVIQNNDMQVIKGDPYSIGTAEKENKSFTKHCVNIEDKTVIYMFSDGYQDQNGGPENLKFSKKKLTDLLMEIHSKPLSEQRQILKATITAWKSKMEQRDDILILGFKI